MESSPEFFHAAEDYKNGEHFIIDELLDFPNDETMMAAADGGLEAAMTGSSTDSSTLTAADTSCNSSFSTGDPSFGHTSAAGEDFSGGDLCVPYEYDELEHMELLSNIVNESFPSEDLQKLHLIQGMKPTRPEEPGSEPHLYQFGLELTRPAPMIRPELSVPAKARSKRSRAAPGNWTSRLLAVSPSPSAAASTSAEADVPAKKPLAKSAAAQRKKEASGAGATTGAATGGGGGGEGRRCLHCATDKTPQWRTGPMGPKTLCNACGVRYKSGRLVPEYRPAASPTFVLTKHSNSHRKVLELRRQKEMMRVQHHHHHHHHHQQQFLHHHQPSMMFDVSNGGEDYLIHQHIGQDFRQLI